MTAATPVNRLVLRWRELPRFKPLFIRIAQLLNGRAACPENCKFDPVRTQETPQRRRVPRKPCFVISRRFEGWMAGVEQEPSPAQGWSSHGSAEK